MTTSTPQKTLNKAMEQAILIFSGKAQGDEDAAYQDLYDAILSTDRLGRHVREGAFTQQTMVAISKYMRGRGLTWEKHIFMPVLIFCRVKPLQYVLRHTDALTGALGSEAFMLAYARLKHFFIPFTG